LQPRQGTIPLELPSRSRLVIFPTDRTPTEFHKLLDGAKSVPGVVAVGGLEGLNLPFVDCLQGLDLFCQVFTAIYDHPVPRRRLLS
jgi:hypothetical protein